MKKREVIELYSALSQLTTEKMSIEFLSDFILMRIKLKKIYTEFEEVRQNILDETKPQDYKEGDDNSEWFKIAVPIIDNWLNEDIDPIDTQVLTIKGFTQLIFESKIKGGTQDILFDKLVKQ